MRKPWAAAAGLVADRVVGEPPVAVHPVVAFGRVMRSLEAWLWQDARPPGVAYTAAGVTLGAGVGWRVPTTTIATTVTVSGHALARAATAVAEAVDRDDLGQARCLLPALVGRDPDSLDEKEILRAVVESVAENTVDAVVAPALWAAVAGAPGALGYRAVNTLDSVVGHRTPRYRRFGWASARLDDAVGWLPARATAALVAAVRPRSAAAVWQAVRRDAPLHPSPNAGVAEAAFAAALRLRLGGANAYQGRVELRPSLGTGRPPEAGDVARAVRLSSDVAWALTGGLTALGLLGGPERGNARLSSPNARRGVG